MQALWMLIASLFFAAMGVLIKLAGQNASLAQIVVFRALFSVLLIGGWALWRRETLINEHFRAHMARSISGISSMWLGFYIITILPLALATTLNYTAPLFVAAYFVFFSEVKPDRVRLLAVGAGFVGVLLLLRPSISAAQIPIAMTGLLGAVFASVAFISIRTLGRVGEPEWRTVLMFSLAALISGLVALPFTELKSLAMRDYAYLIGIGITGFLGQMTMTRAYGKGPALLAGALQYTTIVFAVFAGMLIFNEFLPPLAWAGIGLIIASSLVSTWRTANQPQS